MSFHIRPLNGTLGSAIAVREGLGKENKLAVFADAGIADHAPLGHEACILVSRKSGLAIVDLVSLAVIRRGRLRRPADHIAVSPDGITAIVYTCHPGRITLVDLETLTETAYYNLIEGDRDGGFRLVEIDNETLKKRGIPWDAIPYSLGPFSWESVDEFWRKYTTDGPHGVRRLRFTRGARAVYRADGKVVMPFEFSIKGRGWVTHGAGASPIMGGSQVFSVGVATIDLETRRLDMHVIRSQTETTAYTTFPVQSISPDGRRAILHAFDPVRLGDDRPAPGLASKLLNAFSVAPPPRLAFGLETWAIDGPPALEHVTAFRSLDSTTLVPINTLRFADDQLAEARKEIDLVFPGVESGFAHCAQTWREGPDRQGEDDYFKPLESVAAPMFRPAFNRVHFPPLFAETTQRLAKLHAKPFSNLPWDDLDDRQCHFLSWVLEGWSAHAAHATASVQWIDNDHVVVLSLDGTVREVSLSGGTGRAYRLVDPLTGTWPYVHPTPVLPSLIHLQARSFAVDVLSSRLEFDLPSLRPGKLDDLLSSTPLPYRLVRDVAGYQAEVSHVDRLAEAIRRGYVKIASKEPATIIAGLGKLAREVSLHLDEIVVDDRWLPSLFIRGKPIGEEELCNILVADGSAGAARILDVFLTAFLDATEGRNRSVWHPDDTTPTMGPVALALIGLCDPLPPSVARYFARRDMDHDSWTAAAFERLSLSQERLLKDDLVALQVRLAIQDICTGNMSLDILAHYRLPLIRNALRAEPSRASAIAEVVVAQLEAQASNLSWASAVGVSGLLQNIADALARDTPSEAMLASLLRRRAGN